MRLSRALVASALALLLAGAAHAQVRRFGGGFGFGGRVRNFTPYPNAPYDGRFAFVRVIYECDASGYWYRGLPAWAHGYPMAEQNLMKIMNEVSFLTAHEEITTLTLDDPEIFKYPVIYIIEVSWWQLTDTQAAALRAYMQKGGFIIVDDFKAYGDFGSPGWEPFETNVKRVLPAVRFYEMSPTHPIFHSFFEIDNLDIIPQAYNAGKPIFRGTRITVEFILERLAQGARPDDLVRSHPPLTAEHVQAALAYALSAVRQDELILSP